MLTIRDARSQFRFWADRVYHLQKTTYEVGLRLDHVDLNIHLEQLRIARASKARALEELQTIRGRVPIKSVRLSAVKLGAPFHQRSIPSRATAHSSLVVKSINSASRTIQGWATTPQLDHLGDSIDPLGAEYRLPLPLCWQHRHDQPCGRVLDAAVSTSGIAIKAEIPTVKEPGELKNLVDRAWQSVTYGLVNGLSIGFRPLPDGTERMADGGFRYKRWAWLELSLVTVAANPGAKIEVVAA
jgi:uncharacterized protein